MTTTEQGVESVTPNGTRVYYQSGPKRLYRVNDVEVPSVTSVLGVLEKGGLSHWGQGVGIAGALELFRRGDLYFDHWQGPELLVNEQPATVESVTDLLKQHKLTVNNTLSKAGDRGTSVHRALEVWGECGQIPDPALYPDTERGYVEGLVKFLKDLTFPGHPENIGMEIMVGSATHGYAGRFDLSCRIPTTEFVKNTTPVRGESRFELEAGKWLFDLKTSKGTYDSHHMQLSAYELASVECGYEPTIGQAVVRVGLDGNYVVTRNRAVPEDFLAVKHCYDALQNLKGRK